MARPPGPQLTSPSSGFGAPFPPLQRASTSPVTGHLRHADPLHLAPEDAFHVSPPRRPPGFDDGDVSGSEPRPRRSHRSAGAGARSRSGRRRRTWKKLLWVKQSYPDNYTDRATFLESLQRNPRIQPYDFWPLVADTTVIVQHFCSVIIFVVCFISILHERVSPEAVVRWSSVATAVGWLLWDRWGGQEGDDDADDRPLAWASSVSERASRPRQSREASNSSFSNLPSAGSSSSNLVTSQADLPQQPQLPSAGASSSTFLNSASSAASILSTTSQAGLKPRPPSPQRGGRMQTRWSTAKSAALIYFTLLGMSPILKSLTRSTSPDSIYAMSFVLLGINVFFFDYSSTTAGASKIPVASLPTNAALMASTVLASRLPSTDQVFSLTLVSIEVFGLFPVFRRYARHRSWRYHVILTVLLVLGAGGGVGMIVAGRDDDGRPWRSGLVGMVVACIASAAGMGGCSWWLLSMQKYKNEIHGPWDPARPIIISRRQQHWDDG